MAVARPAPETMPPSPVSPVAFVPALYFMQAMPIFMVQEVSGTIFKSLGVDNAAVASWTALLALPWSFKLLWGPLVDVNGTKRGWVTALQAMMVLGFILAGLALNTPQFFGITLAVFAVMGVLSATVDIATDGFYLLTCSREQQQKFVGWQSLFFRLGRLFATGAVVVLAGRLIENGMAESMAWAIALAAMAGVYGIGAIYNRFVLPHPERDVRHTPQPGENRTNLLNLGVILIAAGFAWMAIGSLFAYVGWGLHFAFPTFFTKWTMPAEDEVFIAFFKVATGPGELMHALRLAVGAGVALALWPLIRRQVGPTEMGAAFRTFFVRDRLLGVLSFMLFYRFSEAMLGRIVPLFLQDKREGPDDPTGGLGFTVEQVGLVNGTFGVIGIVLGGIVGGLVVSKLGLRKAFLLLVAAMQVPNLMYLWAAGASPTPTVMSFITFFDQFGYGFGFAGYLIALQTIAQVHPRYVTAHFAIGTGLGALFIAAAGTLSGALMNVMDFRSIFIIVLLFSIPSLLTIFFVPLDDSKGIEVRDVDVD
jgi:PAT family beta-lactamase induction signal transducer AmpG